MNVLVVGAGPTGLTAAIELRRRGVIATIIDRREAASSYSRAVGITPRSLELLSPAGVSERLIAEGVAMDRMRIYRGQTLLFEMPIYSERTNFPNVLALPQDRTETIMSDALVSLGGLVHYGIALEDFSKHKDQWVAQLSDGSEASFDTIIGADGMRSRVREVAGIAYPGFDLDETWSIADVDAQHWRHPEHFTIVQANPGEVVIVAPLGETRYRVVSNTEDALETLPLSLDVTNIRRQGTFTISVRQAETYSKGGIHLAGDAAHCHSPVGGRGMNIGIADAAELARRLVDGEISDYSAVRHRLGAETIKETERGRKMLTANDWFRRAAFRSFLTFANRVEPIKRRMGRFAVEL